MEEPQINSRLAALLDPDAEWDDLELADPDTYQAAALDRATQARRRASADEADLWSAIAQTLTDAREHPEVWLSAFRGTDTERVEFAIRSAVADLAARLRLAENTIRTYGRRAEILRNDLPLVWARFARGDVPATIASTTAELAESLPVEVRSEFDAALVESAATQSPARFRDRSRRLRDRLHPVPLSERHADAAEARRVWVTDDLDGMSWLTAHLRSTDTRRIMARLDATAHHLADQPDETRTADQLRADITSDLLLSTSDGVPAVTATVAVTVPVLTLLGVEELPGTLDGVAPIPPDTARVLAGGATSWTRILTHPIAGTILDVDRTTYRPPADLARWVKLIHETCYFTGCTRRADDCDIDHVTAWDDDGTTADGNLRPACPPHHRLKHEGGWSVEILPDGRARWTTPTGHVLDPDPDPPPF